MKPKKLMRASALLLAAILALALLPITAGAAGAEIYVSNAGSDTAGDGSAANPYATINKAYETSSSGDTIILLSDIAQTECVSMWHDLTIKSQDGATYTVTRQAGFAPRSDSARSWYNPAMFEAHPDIAGITVTFANIILDDNFLYEGTSFTDQPTVPNDTSGNINRVQDSIIGLYNDPDDIYECTVVLENGAELHNFGGMSAVNIEGHSKLVMKNGSKITNNNTTKTGGGQGIWVIGGSAVMEEGSIVEGIVGPWAINTAPGTLTMNGIVQNNTDEVAIRLAGGSTALIGEQGIVRNNTVVNGAVYCFQGSVLTVKGEVSGNTGSGRASGIYAINNGGNPIVNIENGAKIINNTGTTNGAGILVGNGGIVTMNGGLISGNTNNGSTASGVNVYGYGTFTMNGGEIKDNLINLGIGTKSQGWAYINGGTIQNGTTYDYYIESKEQGYMSGGSFLYLSEDKIATAPNIYFQTNAKTLIPTAENTELYLGNASTASRTALESFVTANYTGSTVLATWFAQVPENALHVTVSGLAAQTDPVYVISYPVAANGTVSDSTDPIVYAVTQDTTAAGNPIDVLASAGSANGRSYAIFAAPDMLNVTFDSQGGSSVPTEAVASGSTAHQPLDPTYRYRRFDGWFTDPDCTTGNEYDFTTPVTQNITLYAKWSLVTEDVDLSNVKIFKNVDKFSGASYDPITFTFNLEAFDVMPHNGTLTVAEMPAIGPLTITMSGTETRQKVNLPTTGFALGGVYTYKVTEVDESAAHPGWTYDATEYYIDLEIEEDSTGHLVLDKVVIHKDSATGTKSDAEFTNTYSPMTELEISKTVSGVDDNPLNATKEFTFDITFTDPGLPGYPSVSSAGSVTTVTDASNNTCNAGDPLAYGTVYTFKLKHGENIKFDLPEGTEYTVTEHGEEYYTPSAEVVEGGTSAGTTNGSYGDDLTVGGTALHLNDPTNDKNLVAFTNTYSITPPTGIKLNTEIILIGAAVLLLIAGGFFVSRRLRAGSDK